MRKAHWTTTALDDVAAIEDYIAAGADEATADVFLDRLRVRCDRLAALPGTLGTERPDLAIGLRSTPHKGYIIYFRYLGDTVEIVNVLDARRDAPTYFNPAAGGD